MLQSSHLEHHMNTIGIDKSLCIRSYFEHICMNNIKKIYQHASKCDDQQNLKDTLDAAMVLTTERVTDNINSVPMTSTPVNEPVDRKSLYLFTNILNFKQKTAKRRIVAVKSNAEP